MNVSIRRMQSTDLDTVFELEKSIFNDPWSKESFRIEIENKQNTYPCVLTVDKLVAGYAIVWYYSGELHIGNFAIHQDYRRKGLGSYLLKDLLEMFKNLDIAYLEVRKSNEEAINLYKKFAFEELYTRENYYSNNEDAIVMWKKLNRK